MSGPQKFKVLKTRNLRDRLLDPSLTSAADYVPGALEREAAARIVELEEALSELVDLMEAVREGDYKPDSFTTQPARAVLAPRVPENRSGPDFIIGCTLLQNDNGRGVFVDGGTHSIPEEQPSPTASYVHPYEKEGKK